MPDDLRPDINRRSFLNFATAGVGAVCVGSAVWALGRAMAPDASIREDRGLTVRVSEIPSGEQVVVKHLGAPYFVRHLTQAQAEEVAAVPIPALWDRKARFHNRPARAEASFENLTFTQDGRVFVVLRGLCTRRRCGLLADVGDFGGWFCPCCASHYDCLGRIRKGIARENMAVPRMQVGAGQVTLLPHRTGPSKEDVERLLWGDPNA